MTFDSNYLAVSKIGTLRVAEPSLFNVQNSTAIGTQILYTPPPPPPQSDENKGDGKSDLIPVIIAIVCGCLLL
eukprot:CAMPEP_0114533166 /NCGR_PEP_ID=MMETSP0109-20121206/27088_1 /TAXON_ID=29199 /ORGANISM="Chlorarachnion reptans, Strain CCCM449" /LENGTH=72 /DNA_ID=CAMNT_0001716347 /DNA_START=478 /DNA_END=693 /DNA_ORIENTATION=+